jgi:hypothetical protein
MLLFETIKIRVKNEWHDSVKTIPWTPRRGSKFSDHGHCRYYPLFGVGQTALNLHVDKKMNISSIKTRWTEFTKDTQKVQKWFPDWNKSKRKERRPEVNQSLYRQLKSGDWSAGGCRGRRHKVYYNVKLVKDPLSHCTANKRMKCNSEMGTSPATASTCHRKNFLTCNHTRSH